MAIGLASDFKIYEPEFQTAAIEELNQNATIFNGASAGAIQLIPRAQNGLYGKEAFFKDIAGLVSRRDTTSVSGVTDLAMTQDENISVKLNRKVGPVGQTLDAFRKRGLLGNEAAQREMSSILGRMFAQEKLKEMANTAIIAVEAAISGVTANNLSIAAETADTATTDALVRGMALLGDKAQSVRALVMHSKPFFNLMRSQIGDKVAGLSDILTIYGATPATLGRPVIVIDAPALFDANGSLEDTYNTLFLTEGAVTLEETEDEVVVTDLVTGLENLVYRFQGEFAYNAKVKGFKWDIANGGSNPSAAALGTATNWDKVATSDKNIAGARLVTA